MTTSTIWGLGLGAPLGFHAEFKAGVLVLGSRALG